jgi:hypothetical protein
MRRPRLRWEILVLFMTACGGARTRGGPQVSSQPTWCQHAVATAHHGLVGFECLNAPTAMKVGSIWQGQRLEKSARDCFGDSVPDELALETTAIAVPEYVRPMNIESGDGGELDLTSFASWLPHTKVAGLGKANVEVRVELTSAQIVHSPGFVAAIVKTLASPDHDAAAACVKLLCDPGYEVALDSLVVTPSVKVRLPAGSAAPAPEDGWRVGPAAGAGEATLLPPHTSADMIVAVSRKSIAADLSKKGLCTP